MPPGSNIDPEKLKSFNVSRSFPEHCYPTRRYIVNRSSHIFCIVDENDYTRVIQ